MFRYPPVHFPLAAVDRSKSTGRIFKQVLLPLIAGLAVYLFFRKDITIFEKAIGWSYLPANGNNPSFVVTVLSGSVPDFCWLFALLNAQVLIWGGLKKIPLALLLVLYIAPPATELLQSLQLMRGTGDWYDVVAYVFAILMHIIIQKQKSDAYEINNQMVI